ASLALRVALSFSFVALLACGSGQNKPSEGTFSAGAMPPALEEVPEFAGSMPRTDEPGATGSCVGAACPCVGGDCMQGPIELTASTMPSTPATTPGTCTDPAGCPAARCDAGTSETAWATSCQSALATSCVPGQWQSWGSSSPENYPLRYETEHFAFLWPDERNVSMQQAQAAGDFLENVVWHTYLESPIFWPEPDCNTANKRKTSIHIIEGGLYGGCNQGRTEHLAERGGPR